MHFVTCPCKRRAPQIQFNSSFKWAVSHIGFFFCTCSWDQKLIDPVSICDKRSEWRGTDHYITSFMLFLDMTSIPPLIHTLSFPQPPSLPCVASSYKHSHVLRSKSKSNSWTEARGLKLRFLIASRLCSLKSVRTGEVVSLPIVSGWNLAARLCLSIHSSVLFCKLGWI